MMTMSAPLSGGQARTYHEREFAAKEANYWSCDQQGYSEWQGKLAERWGLSGPVRAEHFAPLTEGQHPQTQVQMVRHQPAKTYENQFGREVTSVEHRAGWDATFSAPKSVSLTALVGGDERVRKAHRESVRLAVGELERYTQARIGNVHAPESTGKFIAATFEHDTARPVAGYAAPQLHTHAVIFNVTERDDGPRGETQTRALDARSLFGSQQFATSVYRTELASRLEGLGYEIEHGKHGQPEIKGYTPEYLEASSPRREQIKAHLAEIGREGAGAAQVAAHRTRDAKELQSPAEVLHRHRELAAQHGNQADWVVSKALAHTHRNEPGSPKLTQQAVTYARDHVFERAAVQDERAILAAAMDRSMGKVSPSQVREEFDRRTGQGEFRTVGHVPAAGRQYTTAAMLRLEKETIGRMQEGNRVALQNPSLAQAKTLAEIIEKHPQLNRTQQAAAEQIFASREKIVGLEGVAGAGKTTTLAVIRERVEANGHKVEGFAPTSRAAQKLAEAGIETSTLQAHLAKAQTVDTGEKRLYVLDESSLASTKQMHDFVSRLHPNDRALLVGDTRQHEAVEAGRPFAQLQDAGMKTVTLDQIVRQKNPELKQVVEQLARGQMGAAIGGLERQGRVHEVKDPAERIQAIATEYAKSPGNTLIVSPDNRSRAEIYARVHEELQAKGIVAREEYRFDALMPRQDLTGADRRWAARYQFNDVVRYSRASKETGIEKGEYARVKSVDVSNNLLTVVRIDKQEQAYETTYDPRRQQGVFIYREQEKAFSAGDRIQFTAPANDLKIANRELGTIESITDDGRLNLKMDGGRSIGIDPKEHPHLDHGYAVTSHSSQGQTAERVLIHVDTELAAKDLLNNRMAYVAVSRGAHDAQIFTSDREKLPQALSRELSKQSAHMPNLELQGSGQKPFIAESRERVYTVAEQERHHAPIRDALEPEDAAQFKWKGETGTIQTYQHIETGRNLHIDGKTGQFYSQDGKATSQEAALDRAMPEGRAHSQKQHENSLGLGR